MRASRVRVGSLDRDFGVTDTAMRDRRSSYAERTAAYNVRYRLQRARAVNRGVQVDPRVGVQVEVAIAVGGDVELRVAELYLPRTGNEHIPRLIEREPHVAIILKLEPVACIPVVIEIPLRAASLGKYYTCVGCGVVDVSSINRDGTVCACRRLDVQLGTNDGGPDSHLTAVDGEHFR